MTAHHDFITARNRATGLAAVDEKARVTRIAVEPCDEHDDLVQCSQCCHQGVLSYDRRRGCARYVKALHNTPQRCPRFRRSA